MKELTMNKRQRRAVMMVHGADQPVTTTAANLMQAGVSRRNAWPEFVPNEMAERFLNENE